MVLRETIKIPSVEENVDLDVWLYKPTEEGPFPVVVAGHGMTLVKSAGLAVFAERWARDAGYASLVLDYRGFGPSGGLPRNLVSLDKELEDFAVVVRWARARPDLFRADKIVLMGSAIGALPVAELMLRDAKLAGAMTHSPLLDGRATLLASDPKPRLMFWATLDYLCGKLGLPPVYVRAIGKPTEFAFLNTPSCYAGFESMLASSPTPFRDSPNIVAARLVFDVLSWRPGTRLENLNGPMLIVSPEDDDMIPLDITKGLVDKSRGKVQFVQCAGGHFDIMEGGKSFDVNIAAQTNFLRKLLSD